MKSEKRFVYVFLIDDMLVSVSFRGKLVSNADAKRSRDWAAVTALSTFGDASYILLVGPPPYPSWPKKEIHGSSTLSLPIGCSEEFRDHFQESQGVATLFLKLALELSGLGGV
ncbi:MAG TPA: hypothetical protein ENO31_00495 [Thermoprotei archaeon]|nr:hypothetical protein [TACK group archaeon]HEV51012.1 hypothetical protein [Thermoprotei archaeon]